MTKKLKGRLALIIGLWIVLAAGAILRAQATAQISGTVRDNGGGVLPGADVTVINASTGVSRSTVTDGSGQYVLTNLPLGPYRLEVALAGFRSYQQTGIVLQVGEAPTINVTLPIGALTETVSVEAVTPLIETRSPSIGAITDNEYIEELPLNGRQATDLIVLAGAAVAPGGGANASTRSMQGGVGISVAGGQSFGVAYLLDGAMHNNPYDNLNLPVPFPDALQEFRLDSSSTNANNGLHSGASVNMVTKSGTNVLHGDLFEFLRNHRFNATDPFARVIDGKRVDDGLSRNQFGGPSAGRSRPIGSSSSAPIRAQSSGNSPPTSSPSFPLHRCWPAISRRSRQPSATQRAIFPRRLHAADHHRGVHARGRRAERGSFQDADVQRRR